MFMTFINKLNQMTETTFGIIVGNRDVFPDHLAKEGKKQIIEVMNEMGYGYVILSEDNTSFGVVETYQDAKNCAELFKMNKDKIDGILVVLPNFGDEKGIVNTLKLADLNVPILIQASSDEIQKMDRKNRRDAFCGKISVCNVLYQNGIHFSLTRMHTCPISSEIFKEDIRNSVKGRNGQHHDARCGSAPGGIGPVVQGHSYFPESKPSFPVAALDDIRFCWLARRKSCEFLFTGQNDFDG